jgi:Ran GTPase-activating protein (RanGAP) involved in mRNA processing and transport
VQLDRRRRGEGAAEVAGGAPVAGAPGPVAQPHLQRRVPRLSDRSARRIARVIKKNKSITSLDLSNNQIGYEGARCLSVVLGNEASQLKRINLKLNFISDKALGLMFDDMRANTNLLELDLSANLLTDDVCALLSSLQARYSSTSIRSIPPSGNSGFQAINTRTILTRNGRRACSRTAVWTSSR